MSVSSASSGNSPRTRTWYAEDLVPRWLARFCAHLGVAMPRRWSSVPWMRWSARLARNAFSLERRALFSLGSGVRGNDVGFAGEGIVVAERYRPHWLRHYPRSERENATRSSSAACLNAGVSNAEMWMVLTCFRFLWNAS